MEKKIVRLYYHQQIKTISGLLLLLMSLNTYAATKISVFVSFSMPEKLLLETLQDCNRLNLDVNLNGLHQNSMLATSQKIMSLSNLLSNSLPNVQIDPTAFEQYGIQQVPALVVDKGDCFDVIYGNLPIDESLRRLHEKGACQNKSESRV